MPDWLRRSTSALLLTKLTTQAWERSGTKQTTSHFFELYCINQISLCRKMVNWILLLLFSAKSNFPSQRIHFLWDSAALHLPRLWHFGGFWVLFLVASSSHTLLELSPLLFFFSVFLSWHFLAAGMGLNRHVLLFTVCPHTSDIGYHNVLLKHSL